MGIINTANMVRKAMQARSMMSKIKAVGSSGVVKGIVIDGLYSVVAVEVDKESLKNKLGNPNITDEVIDKIASIFEKDIKASMEDAKKQLEKEMSNATSLDDLKGMLQ